MLPIALILGIPFVLGLLFGSFLNVCIERLPRGESVVSPRSRCPDCKAQIRWYDNVPVLSYVLLRRRCRACKEKISFRYPLVESAMGAWFVAGLAPYLTNGFQHVYFQQPRATIPDLIIQYLVWIAAGFLLLGLAIMDFRTMKLPDSFTITGIFIGLFLVCAQAVFLGPDEDAVKLQHQVRINSAGAGRSLGNVFLTGPEHLIYGRLLAVVCAFFLLFGIRWLYKRVRGREGMGLGDAKLLAMIAAFLGFTPALVALFVGLLSATAAALVLLARRRADLATKLPFGTFLCIGGFVAMIVGQPIIAWYTGFLR
ncbi:MAG: prepilin peptidase [Acidobacteria bacterium]|nr:prepilin peptidase [Acidobacteriota bacterium]